MLSIKTTKSSKKIIQILEGQAKWLHYHCHYKLSIVKYLPWSLALEIIKTIKFTLVTTILTIIVGKWSTDVFFFKYSLHCKTLKNAKYLLPVFILLYFLSSYISTSPKNEHQ